MEIIINPPAQGISQSPLVGYANCRDLDIFSIPGIVQLNNVLAKRSATTIDSLPLWTVKNPASPANLYSLSLNGKIWKSTDSGDTWAELTGQTAGGAGQGLIVWKDYLFVCYATGIDVYGPLSGSPAWTKAWQTITTNAWHPMIVSKLDGKIYGGAGQYVFTIEEVSGQNFAPGTPATYTFTAQALDLPEDYQVKCLAELGKIMIGTWKGTNVYDNKIADIFPWDGSSPSYNDPISLGVNGVHAMYVKNGSLYALAGIEGEIFKSNGVSATLIAKIPQSVCDITAGKYLLPYPGAICEHKGRLTFGVSGDGSSTTIGGCGVYSLLETVKGTILNCEHTISTGKDGSDAIVLIGSLLPITRDQIVVGWRSSSSYGIDKTLITGNISTLYPYGTADTYVAYFDSPLYKVGKPKNWTGIQELEISFVKEIAANESIRIAYRTNLNDSFTTLRTFTYADFNNQSPPNLLSLVSSLVPEQDIAACELLEIRVYLCGAATTSNLKSIILR